MPLDAALLMIGATLATRRRGHPILSAFVNDLQYNAWALYASSPLTTKAASDGWLWVTIITSARDKIPSYLRFWMLCFQIRFFRNDSYRGYLIFYIYIYIYVCVCACVCVQSAHRLILIITVFCDSELLACRRDSGPSHGTTRARTRYAWKRARATVCEKVHTTTCVQYISANALLPSIAFARMNGLLISVPHFCGVTEPVLSLYSEGRWPWHVKTFNLAVSRSSGPTLGKIQEGCCAKVHPLSNKVPDSESRIVSYEPHDVFIQSSTTWCDPAFPLIKKHNNRADP